MEIRALETAEEYLALEDLERDIWGMPDIEALPADFMKTIARNGGVLLGAFDPQLVGFVFGFPAITEDGRIKHCSHIAGVARDLQNRDIGYQLKLAQREIVLAQGIDLVTWTFDPLESRNARFNFHKLGAICQTYLHNEYGEMRDALNAGLPSDRFQVDWLIASDRVERHIRGERLTVLPSELQSTGVPVIDNAESIPDGMPGSTERLLIEIPAQFQTLKAANRDEALRWRMHSRELFEEAFRSGYAATDLLIENGRSFYLLEQGSGVRGQERAFVVPP
ncbi:MAG: hypothetical protein ABI882_20240 [Acidobacteriota bacterium]